MADFVKSAFSSKFCCPVAALFFSDHFFFFTALCLFTQKASKEKRDGKTIKNCPSVFFLHLKILQIFHFGKLLKCLMQVKLWRGECLSVTQEFLIVPFSNQKFSNFF